MWARMADSFCPRLAGENHQFSAFLSVYTRFHLKNAVKHIKITWKVIVVFVRENCKHSYNESSDLFRTLSLSVLF